MTEDKHSQNSKTCSICFVEIEKKDAFALECLHIFHKTCVDDFHNVHKNEKIMKCPMCRHEYNNPLTTLVDFQEDISDEDEDEDIYRVNNFGHEITINVANDPTNDFTNDAYSDTVNRTNWTLELAEQLLGMRTPRNVRCEEIKNLQHSNNNLFISNNQQVRVRAARPSTYQDLHENEMNISQSNSNIQIVNLVNGRTMTYNSAQNNNPQFFKFLYDDSPAEPFSFEPSEQNDTRRTDELSTLLNEIHIEQEEQQKNFSLRPDYLD